MEAITGKRLGMPLVHKRGINPEYFSLSVLNAFDLCCATGLGSQLPVCM
jgi:hypothetical protein